jgi:exodeoxyribonuclease V beta subunit
VQSTGSLFESAEAEEMLRLLRAMAEPGDEGKLKAALLTDLLGVTGDGLARLLGDERAWAGRLQAFREYHELWLDRGILAACRILFAREGVRKRLLPLPGGERRLTNLLHCCEALYAASLEGKLGPERLVRWLGAQLREPSEADEHQLRLETDAQAVRIVTIHRSKGLEYPIVFCPYCWGAPREDEGPVSFHAGAPRRREFLDLGSEAIEAHRELARDELLAEDLRLLYVALTRAKYRCYLLWGPFRDAERSALGYLLHGGGEEQGGADGEIRAELGALESLAGGALEIVPLAAPSERVSYGGFDAEAAKQLSARSFRGRVPDPSRVSSFTGLVSSPAEAEEPDRDHLLRPRGEEEAPEPGTFLAFPRGARAGQCLHDLFEGIDFRQPDSPVARAFVARKLAEYAFEPEWLGPVLAMVREVLRLPLIGGSTFSLGGLRPEDRAHEVEFLFPCSGLTPKGLRDFFRGRATNGPGARLAASLEELEFAPTSGFLKGFIDLLFHAGGRYYVVDWKSNFLGSDPARYGREALEAVMVEEHYVLQYHLYALALHKHLQRALPGYDYEAHFGGVYYLFLRGIRPDFGPDAGVFHDRPSRSFLEEFSRFLSGEPTGASR